jgi:hypothetical protein
MDLDSIEPGLDFAEIIEQAVGSCSVLVALIGRQWATLTDEQGDRRLDNPDDFVRFEVQAALQRGVRVIPVLVDGARPLRQQDLPAELHKLPRLNAHTLSYTRYKYDTDQLVDLIQRVLAAVSERGEAERKAREDADRQAREQADRQAQEDADLQAQERIRKARSPIQQTKPSPSLKKSVPQQRAWQLELKAAEDREMTFVLSSNRDNYLIILRFTGFFTWGEIVVDGKTVAKGRGVVGAYGQEKEKEYEVSGLSSKLGSPVTIAATASLRPVRIGSVTVKIGNQVLKCEHAY